MFGLSFETISFILIILGLTIYFVLTYTKGTKQRQQIATHAPTILTTIGIFATFFAIAVGLSKFDTTNIQQGVPALLNALKTAFWASVVGVGGAITIKVISYIYPPEEDDNQAVTQLIKELQRLHKNAEQQTNDNQFELLKELKLLRKENNEHLTTLSKTQQEALEKLAEMGTQALIKALEDVIRDFNQKITEQFGENFKQLNSAVEQILIWQKENKVYVENSSRQLTEVINNMEKATKYFEQIVDNSTAFTKTAEGLANIIKLMEGLNRRNTQYLENLVTKISDKERGLPSIEQKLIAIVEQIENAMQENNNLLKEATQETKKRVDELNKGMENALTDALKQITGNLSALSEKFAQDYTPIANHLERLVQLAKQNR